MSRTRRLGVATLLVCAVASATEARTMRHGIPHVSTHKTASLHAAHHRHLAMRRRAPAPLPERSPVCGPAYDLVFHQTVCLDPRYIY